MTFKDNDTLKKMDENCKEWTEVAIGACILTWTWLPKACMKAYTEYKEEKTEDNEDV